MQSYVLCVRDVLRDSRDRPVRFSTGLGEPSYLAIPWSAQPPDIPPKDEPLPEHRLDGPAAWLETLVADAKTRMGPAAEMNVVFFVHGYNTDPIEALKRQRLVEIELGNRGFPCLVIGFDWPTGGTPEAYLYDRHEATQAALALVTGGIFPFALYGRADCPIRVHVLAHSMGGYVIREAFRGGAKARLARIPRDWRIGQMVLFAADISSGSFEQGRPDMRPVFDHCGRLTNYFSGYDEALAVSNLKNMDISSRVGRVGMPTDKPTDVRALDVDCGPRYQAVETRTFKVISGMVSHSWYLEDPVWYDDLAFTLKGGYDRNVIPTRVPSPSGLKDDFVLNAR